MDTAALEPAPLDEARADGPVDLDPAKEPDVAEEEPEHQEELLTEDEPGPAPDVLPPAAPTAEEKLEAEREKDRRRFEARRAGRMYFVRHPRAPEDPGAAQLPLAHLGAWSHDLLCGLTEATVCTSRGAADEGHRNRDGGLPGADARAE